MSVSVPVLVLAWVYRREPGLKKPLRLLAVNGGGALLVVFDGVLVDGAVDDAGVIEDGGGLRAFAGTEEAGDGNRRQQGDDGHHDHDFDEGKAPRGLADFL